MSKLTCWLVGAESDNTIVRIIISRITNTGFITLLRPRWQLMMPMHYTLPLQYSIQYI